MLFDWFTIFAQIGNFLILMWLLKRFLYKPVLDVIDAREQRIATLLQETKTSQEQAEQQKRELTEKNSAYESERQTLLSQVKVEAVVERKKLLDKVSKEVAAQREQWLLALKKEQQTLEQDISLRTHQEVLNVARKALSELSGSELEGQIAKVFIERIENMSQAERDQFNATNSADTSGLVIHSAFSFDEKQKSSLSESIKRVFSSPSPVHFIVDPSLIGGVDLVANGRKISWNLANYLSDLEASIKALIDNKKRFREGLENG